MIVAPSTAPPLASPLPFGPLLPANISSWPNAGADCAWCRYGKPAALGAAIGAAGNLLLGMPAARGAVIGAAAGLAYGYMVP